MTRCTPVITHNKHIPTPPTWRGFSFALHLLRVQGFYFCPAAIQPHTSVYSVFCVVNAVYRPRYKTVHRALQWHFLRFYPFSRHIYQTDTSGYNTIYATLEHAHAPGRPPAHTRYHRHAGRCTGQHRPHIIIRYIRGCMGAPVMDPCQTVQQIADHASPAGSRCFPRPAACNLAPAISGAHRVSPAPSTRRGSPSAGRGGRRGTIDGYRRIFFRAVAR